MFAGPFWENSSSRAGATWFGAPNVLPQTPKALARSSKSGLLNLRSEWRPLNCAFFFNLIRPYSPSNHTIMTMLRPRRIAISMYYTFIKKPETPLIASTRRPGMRT